MLPLPAQTAVERAENDEIIRSSVSKYLSTYLALVALTAVLTAGANLVLEVIIVAVLWSFNRGHDGKDFLNRLALVSAGPLIRINVWSIVLIILTFMTEAPGLYVIGMIIVGLYYHAKRIKFFRQLMEMRIAPIRKSPEYQTEKDELEAEAERLRRLKADEQETARLREEIAELKGEGAPPETDEKTTGVVGRIAKAHKLHRRGVYSENEYMRRKDELIHEFDWSSVDRAPEDVLDELVELGETGAVSNDDIASVKKALFDTWS